MFYVFAIIGFVVMGVILLLVLFEPGLDYDVAPPKHPLDSDAMLCVLGALSDAQVHRGCGVEVLTNGNVFYEAELAAIAAAKRSINLEAYIFNDDAVGRRFVAALTERARAGVKVNVIVDAIGSFATRDRTFASLREAGGRAFWYQPIRWYTLKRFNNRTHRELIVIDGEVGFIGGAGIGDDWLTGSHGKPAWRDTFVRVSGGLVVGLQTTFVENWLEAADEILTGEEYFPACDTAGPEQSQSAASQSDDGVAGFVVNSAPSAGRSTRARVLFQTLLASAQQTIHINSPYFLPDRSVRRELKRAVERGVKVRVITPGEHSDHAMTRSASRRRYGELLRGGVEIYEYDRAMIHVKALIVDGVWSVVGSTNFDNRSFGINDEVNLAASGRAFAERLEQDFQHDMEVGRRITWEDWQRRPIGERLLEILGAVIERQQ